MNQALKQRIVGGIVLGSLLLIIIPMAVDFSREEVSPLTSVSIPPGPDVMKMEVMPLDQWSKKVEPEINTQNKIIETPTPKTKSPVTPVKKKVVPPVVKKKAVPTNSTDARVWAVQVASLGTESKALKLRNTLRDLGYASFVERGAKASGRTIYRVKVGPVLSRTRAKVLQKKVLADVKLEGLVVRHK